eukprot:9492229-Lingulodinium_polyedra.AAC.1
MFVATGIRFLLQQLDAMNSQGYGSAGTLFLSPGTHSGSERFRPLGPNGCNVRPVTTLVVELLVSKRGIERIKR